LIFNFQRKQKTDEISISQKNKNPILDSIIMRVLLINPPIYDFAVYDFWMKPLGLLYISSILKEKGHEVRVLDAVNRFDPYYKTLESDSYGRGRIKYKKVEKPQILKDIPGKFKRYGLPATVIKSRIKDFEPEVIMLGCSMTYWYPGLIEIKGIIKELRINCVLLLGGIYSSLLPEHARNIGFNIIYSQKEKHIEELNITIPEHFKNFPPPDYSHYSNILYACLCTSLGCPFDCPYCASSSLYANKTDKEEGQIIEEISYLYKKGINKIAFYDDALLIPQKRFISLCEKIAAKKMNISFFTPNGLHSRFISKDVAKIMRHAGFKEPRISLETSDENIQRKLYMKTTNSEFREAVENLKTAGYKSQDIFAYLLAGMPGMNFSSVEKSILYVAGIGVKISLAEFSPIPGTKMEENLPDPLLTNNTVYYHYKNKEKEMIRVKSLAKEANRIIG
jgi:radical SAM superfamily enzyme YgiQ (UPF0313 family)